MEKYNHRIKMNEYVISLFRGSLAKEEYTSKTIEKHINNVELYLDFLAFNLEKDYKEGVHSDCLSQFFGYQLIYKCGFTANGMKEMSASLKKFYLYLLNNNEITSSNYEEMKSTLKDHLEDWIQEAENPLPRE